MKIINLTENSKLYTANVFLALGEWNAVDDMNTLIDVGSNHSDHSSLLPQIKKIFNPKIYAFDIFLKGVDQVLKDGDMIRIGEKQFEVFHTPIHSSDSICLFCKENGKIFVGDTPIPNELKLQNTINSYPDKLLKNWSFVNTIYFGHGNSKQKKFDSGNV